MDKIGVSSDIALQRWMGVVGVVGILWTELAGTACFGQQVLERQKAEFSAKGTFSRFTGFSENEAGGEAGRLLGVQKFPDGLESLTFWRIFSSGIGEPAGQPTHWPPASFSAVSKILGQRLVQPDPPAEVWLINTHQTEWETELSEALSSIQYWRFDGSGAWQATEQKSFFSTMSRSVPTLIYIHGNWADPATAIQQAWTIYGVICQGAENRPFRLWIWCWPAERISARLLTDLRFKAGRSDVEAYLLACHLNRLASSGPILLVGYSFGARVITGALHLVGGGRLMGRTLQPDTLPSAARCSAFSPTALPKAIRVGNGSELSDRWLPKFNSELAGHSQGGKDGGLSGRFRAILVAAAIGNDWLLPGGRHQQALGQLEKMLVTVNRADPALRWYARLEPCDSPALGWAGPARGFCSASPPGKIEWLSVTSWVGKQHNWHFYFQVPRLQARVREYLFGSEKSSP